MIGVAVADLHWPEIDGRGPWADEPEISGDVEYALKAAVNRCQIEGADLYLAGDNFDGPDPEPASVARLYAILRPLITKNSHIYYVLGNHDRGRDWLAPFGPHAVRLEDGQIVPTRFRDVTVSGMSYRDPALFRDAFLTDTRPVSTIGVYHQSFQEFAGGSALSVEMLPPHKLSLCGDTHVVRSVALPRGTAVSPGAMVPQATAEFGDGQMLCTIDDDCCMQFEKLSGRRYARYQVANGLEADRVIAELAALRPDLSVPKAIARPMAAIKLTGDVPGFVDTARRLADDGNFVLRVSDNRTRSSAEQSAVVACTAAANLSDVLRLSTIDDRVKRMAIAAITPGADPCEVFRGDINSK